MLTEGGHTKTSFLQNVTLMQQRHNSVYNLPITPNKVLPTAHRQNLWRKAGIQLLTEDGVTDPCNNGMNSFPVFTIKLYSRTNLTPTRENWKKLSIKNYRMLRSDAQNHDQFYSIHSVVYTDLHKLRYVFRLTQPAFSYYFPKRYMFRSSRLH